MTGKATTCPHCGAPIFATDSACLSCGAQLDEGHLADAPHPPPARTSAVLPPPSPAGYRTVPGTRAWDPRELGVGGDFFTRLARGWTFLRQAFLLIGQDARLLVPSVLSVLTMAVLVGITLGVIYLTGNWETFFREDQERLGLAFWALVLPLSFGGYLATYFFQGMTVQLVAALLRGERETLELSAGDCCRHLPALTLLAGASVVVSLASSAVRGGEDRGLRRAAGDAIDSAWHAVVLLVLPVIILEGLPFPQAFQRAGRLHARHLGDLLISWFGVGLVNRVIGTVAMVVAFGVALGLYALLGTAALPLAIGVVVLMVFAVSVLTAYLNTAYYTCLYLWAAATERAGAPVPAPAPLYAAAW